MRHNLKNLYSNILHTAKKVQDRIELLDGISDEEYMQELSSYYSSRELELTAQWKSLYQQSSRYSDYYGRYGDIRAPLPDICHDCNSLLDEQTEDSYQNCNQEAICSDCDESYYNCNSCDEKIHADDSYDYMGEILCESCFYENYGYCAECGDVHTQDELRWEEQEGESYCRHCYRVGHESISWNIDSVGYLEYAMHRKVEERQWDSDDKDEVITYNKYVDDPKYDVITSKRAMGVELEVHTYSDGMDEIRRCCKYSLNERVDFDNIDDRIGGAYTCYLPGGSERKRVLNEAQLGVKVVSDGSINGLDDDDVSSGEVVLEPRNGSYLIDDVHLVTTGLKYDLDAFVTSRCGFHLHIDSRDFDWYHRATLAVFTKLLEPHLYSWLPQSRRTNSYSRPMSQSFSSMKNIKSRTTFLDFWYDTNSYDDDRHGSSKRYYALNMHPSFCENRTGSIELRHHQGTLNTEKVQHWATLWGCIFDKTKTIAEQLYAYNGELCIKALVSDMLALDKNIQKDDNISDKYIDDYNDRFSPIIDIDNLFTLMDIPESTKIFYTKMLQNRLLDTRNTSLTHYKQCFDNRAGVVEFSTDKLRFELCTNDFECFDVSSGSSYIYRNQDYLPLSNIEHTLLGKISKSKYLIDDEIAVRTYGKEAFISAAYISDWKYRLKSNVEAELTRIDNPVSLFYRSQLETYKVKDTLED
tara:strand:+ start:9272 stop:11359 length:2088 start_codon:yes stop_codon:yes gene_type:complete